MAYHRGQNSTFKFNMFQFCNFYLDLQLNIQVSYFSTPIVDLTLFVSRFNFVVRSIQHSSLRNSTFNFRKYPTASQSMRVSVGSANYQNTPLVGAGKCRSLHHNIYECGRLGYFGIRIYSIPEYILIPKYPKRTRPKLSKSLYREQ